MTIRANARVAGATFLVYIAAGLSDMTHSWGPLVSVALTFVQCFSALVLAVTLRALTRSVDPDLATVVLVCRTGEGVLGAVGLMVKTVAGFAVPAMFFAVGSLVFSSLLVRGRLVPMALAWLGVLASVLLVIALPVQQAGSLPRSVATLMYLPMLAFEVPLGVWLIVRGVRPVA